MNEEFAVLLFAFGISLTANIALIIGVVGFARRARRFENRAFAPSTPDHPRIERVEQMVDGLDVRIEQLARGQEFLSKLVSERRRALSAREHEVTPR